MTAHRTPKRSKGLTLLEVILALAILGMSLAAVGEAIRLGGMNAARSRHLTTAQILADGKMSEIASGAAAPETIEQTPSEFDPQWLISIASEPASQEGLLVVTVTVEQDPQENARPASFTLKRWMVDPATQTDAQAGSESLDDGTLP